MDTTWLEDFLALAEHGNFSRAAEARHVTQPAFSRRIRQLEDWAGAVLFDRDTHRIALTPSGDRLRPVADEVLRRLQFGREEVIEAAVGRVQTLRFAATHALSLTFFPPWLRSLDDGGGMGPVSLVADSMQACEKLMLSGEANFLLCHHHPSAETVLDPRAFASLSLGADALVPVSSPGRGGEAAHALPGAVGRPVPHLAYSAASGMGRILAAARARDGRALHLDTVFQSHAASVLRSLAADGRGAAWLPLCLVAEELSSGRLVRAGDGTWDVPLEIRLVRPRARQSAGAETFWARLRPFESAQA